MLSADVWIHDDEPCFVLNRHSEPDFKRASSRRQQSAGRHVLPRHIILTLGRQVFALTPKCCMLTGEAANTNFNVFGLTWPGI